MKFRAAGPPRRHSDVENRSPDDHDALADYLSGMTLGGRTTRGHTACPRHAVRPLMSDPLAAPSAPPLARFGEGGFQTGSKPQ